MKENLTNFRQRPLPITYVTTLESEKRIQWFINFKYPILDALTKLQEGGAENKKLDFIDLKTAIEFFKRILVDSPNRDSVNGVRAYFASPSSDGTVSPDKCGKLTLIFVATIGEKNSDIAPYYSFKDGDFVFIPEDEARAAVHNFQNIKRNNLFSTLSDDDRQDDCKETKHLLFSIDQIEETIAEMEYQSLSHGDIVKGFGIRFSSYTDQDYRFENSKVVQYHKRLTIGFSFIDWQNEDIGIKQIDPVEFKERLTVTISKERFIGDTFDTGDPTPPPSSGNKAALDVSDQ